MSAFFSSIKNMVDNYGQGIVSIQAQFEDMKFGLMPSSSPATPSTVAISITNALYSTPSTTTSSSTSSSRKNSYNNNINITNNNNNINMSITQLNATSDFNQWLHAMKMVARLPGGTPPEFRRKLWLALADRHLHNSGIDWNKEQAKCLSEKTWLDDDEELGIQIVKDLHRTGSSLFSGPNGSINQAKLKSVLLGYARWNPEVGYCQGFNMLGALILQVMERSEIESLKVMIYLIEGVLPKGYFSGSLGGLQADMAVFREILSTRLPKLSKHLQKLQGTIGENSMEPPIINVFTMQWFLTLFCTCLPKSCVLRVWDLVLIEGSDILLRTALAIWASIADRIMTIKSADEFYCKMGTLSGELLNGHLFDSNGLIQRIVELGPIADLQKMREKHLFNITPWKDRKGLKIFYSDDDVDSDDENWKMSGARKPTAANRNQSPDTRERIALDISILKKQYAKLRERQRQANTTNMAKQQQSMNATISNTKPSNINQYLIGRNAIVSKGKRIGPPAGSIPPARISLPMSVANKYQQKRLRNATIDNASISKLTRTGDDNSNVQKKSMTRKRSESSSYSEDSDKDSDDEFSNRVPIESSSSDTSLCDDDIGGNASSIEASPLKSRLHSSASDDCSLSKECNEFTKHTYIRFNDDQDVVSDIMNKKPLSQKNSLDIKYKQLSQVDVENNEISTQSTDEKIVKNDLDLLSLPSRDQITSTSQLSPIADISHFLASSTISPLKTPTSYLLNSYPLCEVNEENQEDAVDAVDAGETDLFKVSEEEGVTNAYFERINHATTKINEPRSQFELSIDRELIKDDEIVNEDVMEISTGSASNKNTERILKMIEENSKILDRIMSKNAQCADDLIELKTDVTPLEKRDSEPEAGIIVKEVIISSIPDEKSNELEIREYKKPIPEIIETFHDVDEPIKLEKCDSSSSIGAKTGDDAIFKYGDLSECISKYLNNPMERRSSEGEKEDTQKSESIESLVLPTSLSLLTHDENSSEDIKNLLKQSFLEYSKSPSESLPIDSKLENDLETLLKMSAELLRDEFPIGSSELSDAKDDLNLMSIENNTTDLMSTTISDLDSTDPMESQRNSSYYDPDTLQSEMESVAGDISATISSIKNTIKSIDSLCQDDDRRSRDPRDKTLDDIIKVVEKLDEEKEMRSRSQDSRSSSKSRLSDKSRPSMAVSSVLDHASRDDDLNDSNLSNPRYAVGSRMSRDRSRMTSPRRRKDDDFGEYESRARRTKSPSSFALSSNRYSGDFTSKFGLEKTKPSLIGSEQSSSSDSGSKANTSSPYKSLEKLEIRHTTVTSTFYDRFLLQKYEQQHKMDRSPSSPVINKAYLNSLKPTSSLTHSYHSTDSDYKQRRASRSNETSPANLSNAQNRFDSLKLTSTAPKSGYLHLPQLSTSNSIHRSCDNILSNLSSTTGSAEFIQKYSPYQSKNPIDTIDTDAILKRHSTAAFNQTTSLSATLPIKPKKPSELGIKLGLYKP